MSEMNWTKIKTKLRWTRTSFILLSGVLLLVFLIGYIWWPLLEDYLSYMNPKVSIWQQLDWLLIGNFLVMSILIILNADLRRDIPYVIIGLAGGFIIESWGTLSGLWTYYTHEKPPLWIIPAWPIATLAVHRLYMIAKGILQKTPDKVFSLAYWPVFIIFYIMLLIFTRPALGHPLTIFALGVCLILILTARDKHSALSIFLIGSGLGYFLERWGTTRLCWTYYTGGTPPIFTVLAHGMASLAVWRVYKMFEWVFSKLTTKTEGFAISNE
jgi:cell division protein FtsW (lipid II flippase)